MEKSQKKNICVCMYIYIYDTILSINYNSILKKKKEKYPEDRERISKMLTVLISLQFSDALIFHNKAILLEQSVKNKK